MVSDWQSKIYGAINPSLTAVVVGMENSETLNYTLATTGTQYSNIGSYPIAITLGSNPNYNVTSTNALLTVVQKTVTVVADAQSNIYGAINQSLTAVVVGLDKSETLNYTLATTGTN